MSTSLAEQLQKLRAPQTSLLLQDKKRPSFLFDPKEAANFDRETVYNIGKNGFEDLVRLSTLFQDYESTIFAPSSIGLQRSVLDQKINKKLDSEINGFLILLSPYFLLNTAHKALEWLIYRFQIHQYNKDAFLMLILPYHETRIFVRALQLIDLTNQADKWHWLEPLQKPGVPLSSLTLVNRVATDNGFLKLLCNHVVTATTIYGEESSSLSTLFAFYTMAVVGALDRAPEISEVQVNHLLHALSKGLTSSTIDFASSSYMIIAKLSYKTSLNDQTIEYLLLKALEAPKCHHEVLILVFFIYEATKASPSVSETVVMRICMLPWFVDEVMRINRSNSINIKHFLFPLLESALKCILNRSSVYKEMEKMVKEIFQKVSLQDVEVNEVLKNVLNPSIVTRESSEAGRAFLSQIYGFIEIKYVSCFDEYLKNLMKNSELDKKSKAEFKFLMTYYSRAQDTKQSLNVWDKLNHRSPERRITALKILSKNVRITENFDNMINKSLLNRFDDDDVRVIGTLLKFPLGRLKKLIPTDILVDKLIILLSQCHTDQKMVLACPALKLLLQVCHEDDDTSIFVATLPYLFPSNDEEIEMAMEVLNSEFGQKNAYLQAVKADLGDIADAESISSAAFHNILNWELLPSPENIITTMKLSPLIDATTLFFNLVLLGSVCRVPVGSLPSKMAREVIDMAAQMIKQYPRVKSLSMSNQLNGEHIQDALSLTSRGVLPLQAATYVLEMVHRRLDLQSNSLLDFEDDPDYAMLVLRLLEILFEGLESPKRHVHYSWCLKIFFQRHFPTSKHVLCFLSQFFTRPVLPQTSLHALNIISTILNSSDSFIWIFNDRIFIPNLLIVLSRGNRPCREAAVNILKKISTALSVKMYGCTLIGELAARSMDINFDCDQLSLICYTLMSPDPDVVFQIKKDLRKKLAEAREFLFAIINDGKTPLHVSAQLMEVLAHVNGSEILRDLASQGLKLFQKLQKAPEEKIFAKMALKNILQRFNSSTVNVLKDSQVWKLFQTALNDHQLQIPTENGIQTPSIIIIKQIDEVFFENCGKLTSDLQKKILTQLVDIVTHCEVGSIVTAADRAVRRVRINALLVVDELKTMKNAKVPEDNANQNMTPIQRRRAKVKEATMRSEVINTKEWKRGITILEFIQRAENIKNEKLLIPELFALLRMCLAFEEQSPLEYTNQLLLSTIYHLASKNLPIPDADAQVNLVSLCIRLSQNPQTHHHALLVLVELFKVADLSNALHNIMPIFTFIGSTVLRQDDAYSVQIITKTIETIIPIINEADDEAHACSILRVFVISLPDIPEHRRIPLFMKLLQLLEHHLHLFYLLIFERHVLSGKDSLDQQTSSQRLEFALSISKEFPPGLLINTCIKLIKFVRFLPLELEEDVRKRPIFKQNYIFDVKKNTPKQLRHYKYTIVQFLSALLSSIDFVNRVAMCDPEESDAMRPSYDKLMIELILMIQVATKSADIHQGKPKGKYWKVLLHNVYDILDAVNGLLPNNLFITTVNKLINHDLLPVRKKILELTNSRLSQRKFNPDEQEDLLQLIDPLLEIIKKHGKILSQEMDIIQQTALITLKLLSKSLASDHPRRFKPVLEITTDFLKFKDGPLLGSLVLCVAELCASMRTNAISHLNKFVPQIIKLLKTHCNSESPDVVVLSIVTALQKIVESLGNFLSLYLDQLLMEICRLSSRYADGSSPKVDLIVSRVKAISTKLSACIPLRVLLPAVSKTYQHLLESNKYQCIAPLMVILGDSFENMSSSDLGPAISELGSFFLKVLEFRERLEASRSTENDDQSRESIDTDDEVCDLGMKAIRKQYRQHVVHVEASVSAALISLVLKLSESIFRPFYYKLYDWAARNPAHKHRNITFYKLSLRIADALKSLFVLFAGHFLKHAAVLLTQNNLALKERGENTFDDEIQRIELIEAILMTLYKIFSYDAHNFVNEERFDTLAQPIVDQIENIVGTKEEFEQRARDIVIPCIAAFVSATQDDSLYKQVIYQTLLKTRHTLPYVRSAALSAVVEIARKLGEDFMPLLPETIPFLAELLEDEDEVTEKATQIAVRTLEEILGEPLQKYF